MKKIYFFPLLHQVVIEKSKDDKIIINFFFIFQFIQTQNKIVVKSFHLFKKLIVLQSNIL